MLFVIWIRVLLPLDHCCWSLRRPINTNNYRHRLRIMQLLFHCQFRTYGFWDCIIVQKRRSVESHHIRMLRRGLALGPGLVRNWTSEGNFPQRDLRITCLEEIIKSCLKLQLPCYIDSHKPGNKAYDAPLQIVSRQSAYHSVAYTFGIGIFVLLPEDILQRSLGKAILWRTMDGSGIRSGITSDNWKEWRFHRCDDQDSRARTILKRENSHSNESQSFSTPHYS